MKVFYIILFMLLSYPLHAEYVWENVNGPGSYYFLYFAESSRNIYICAGGGIFKSIDDGRNWIEVYRDEDGVFLGGVSIYQDSILYLSVNDSIFYSLDGGRNLVNISPKPVDPIPSDSIQYYYQINLKDDTLIAFTYIEYRGDHNNQQQNDSGMIMYSTDRGKNWQIPDFFKKNKSLRPVFYIYDKYKNLYFTSIYDTWTLESINSVPVKMQGIEKLIYGNLSPNFLKGKDDKIFLCNPGSLYALNSKNKSWDTFHVNMPDLFFDVRYANGRYSLLDGYYLYYSDDEFKSFVPIREAIWGFMAPPTMIVTSKGTIFLEIDHQLYRGYEPTGIKDEENKAINKELDFSSSISFINFISMNSNSSYEKDLEIYNLQGILLLKTNDLSDFANKFGNAASDKLLFFRFRNNGREYTGKVLNF